MWGQSQSSQEAERYGDEDLLHVERVVVMKKSLRKKDFSDRTSTLAMLKYKYEMRRVMR